LPKENNSSIKLQQLAVENMDPRFLAIKDFTYILPQEKIAKYPLAERDASKLLIYRDGKISESIYRDIAGYIPEGSLLLFNNTRVTEARILFKKETGGVIEIFALEPADGIADITAAMLQKEKVLWKCMIGGASKWKHRQLLEKKMVTGNRKVIIQAAIKEKFTDSFLIEFSWQPQDLSFAEILHFAGVIPLPPYIKREAEAGDAERYQTIYAQYDGSVAAPTAGLHFTENIFQSFLEKNIHHEFVTLHVGAGTFKPVKSETMQEHDMHPEFIDVPAETIKRLMQQDKNIFAVGTTSLRTLESIYLMGIKTKLNPGLLPGELELKQWEAYDVLLQHQATISVQDALQSLLVWMEGNNMKRLITRTRLLIAPGYSCKTITGLISNFHQPQSTLLLLVAAIAGNNWKKIYEYALQKDFRFLSYGDGCLIFI
jgi:S-adenosylmethionine:tRNA ribosyltransferase-isomerase